MNKIVLQILILWKKAEAKIKAIRCQDRKDFRLTRVNNSIIPRTLFIKKVQNLQKHFRLKRKWSTM